MNNTKLPPFSLIIPAGGQGTRLGHDKPKAFVRIHDLPLLQHTLNAFNEFPSLQTVIIAVPEEIDHPSDRISHSNHSASRISFCTGGSTRFESVRRAYNEESGDSSKILIHDAARPMVTNDIIRNIVRQLEHSKATFPAIPINDAVHRTRNEHLIENVDRGDKVRAQTPQGFHREILNELFHRAYQNQSTIPFPDEASLVQDLGYSVTAVSGNPKNLKITYPEHLNIAEKLLSDSS